MAILLVSHDLGLIRKYADRVVLLDKTVVAQGDANQGFCNRRISGGVWVFL